MEAVRGQKHPSEAKNGMKKLIYWKEYLIKVFQQPLKPLNGSNQIWPMTSDKKIHPATSIYVLRVEVATAATAVTAATAFIGKNTFLTIVNYWLEEHEI